MSELLKLSIEKLSNIVNLSTGLAHPLDKSRAQELFIALRDEGESLTYEKVRGLAIANHWPDRHADSLAELAQHIGSGGLVNIEHPRDWGEPTVALLKKQIGK
ncbi:MAG: hypothetical protein J0I94_00285 [Thiobacillus sp.]|jgi:hypothetical protein|nr:hypothetical protein [Thiobacillus sp.]